MTMINSPRPVTLIVCAHHQEAKAFFEHENWVKEGTGINQIYRRNDGTILLISGEGLAPTLTRVSFILGAFNGHIARVINIGIAGSLDPSLAIGSVLSVRSVYASHVPGAYEFHSFTSGCPLAEVDCISSGVRVMNNENLPFYRAYARIVDRELWAIGTAARSVGVPFYSAKCVSDHVNNVDCKIIREQSATWSENLRNFVIDQKWLHPKADEKPALEWSREFPNCHFTQSARDQLNKWGRILSLQQQVPAEDMVAQVRSHPEFLQAMTKLGTPKSRALAILKVMERIATHV